MTFIIIQVKHKLLLGIQATSHIGYVKYVRPKFMSDNYNIARPHTAMLWKVALCADVFLQCCGRCCTVREPCGNNARTNA